MTTKLDIYEKLLDRFVAHASENKWPLATTLPEHRKKLGTAAIVTEIEVRCGPPLRRRRPAGLHRQGGPVGQGPVALAAPRRRLGCHKGGHGVDPVGERQGVIRA